MAKEPTWPVEPTPEIQRQTQPYDIFEHLGEWPLFVAFTSRSTSVPFLGYPLLITLSDLQWVLYMLTQVSGSSMSFLMEGSRGAFFSRQELGIRLASTN